MIRIMVWIPHKEVREVQMDCGRGVQSRWTCTKSFQRINPILLEVLVAP